MNSSRSDEANRWLIACAGVVMQIALGAVYAWSIFRNPLAKAFGWTISEVTWTFTICILAVGFAAFFAGLWIKRSGPRIVAMTGGALYGLGVALASLSAHRLWWLYLSYGLIGGMGLGSAYIVPVAVLVKWFPDRRGLLTGVAVGGFGAGALVFAPIATRLIQHVGVLPTFGYLGVIYLLLTVGAGAFMRNPPPGWLPAGYTAANGAAERSTKDYTLPEALRTVQWWALWGVLFLNTSAGISLISQEAPVFQELAGATSLLAATLVGIASIGNAFGRVFWATLSDYLTRRVAFVLMFLVQVLLFWLLPGLHSSFAVGLASFLILTCYGGGFGTMPAFAADYFGPENVGSIYGLMLTAWGLASAFGPILIAHLRQTSGSFNSGLHAIALIIFVSAILPFTLRPPKQAQ